ncbi:hypothetical protein PaeCFBP13512_18835 [Paenibacillus sp. CFBP13512]|uniref:hypothetical protein n=1 Tax=Paenibacillus sp. CFBP13512 TaxID=2184007 RepID=UPI0010C08E5A|nr:hypothetical protein [Paenibacillus sp. CFBP13512]TKJ87278.1 hypothetical protein PaeCFBP13512_18835 [Paenibacillus sp. CFBP13512]
MEITSNFKKLKPEIQQAILSEEYWPALTTLLDFERVPSPPFEHRSHVFKAINDSIAIKLFTDRSKNGHDIKIHEALSGIPYYPDMYAYIDKQVIIIEKASGEALNGLLKKQKISKGELQSIREQYSEAVKLAAERNVEDWDFKLEHIFWDQKTKKLMKVDLGGYDLYTDFQLDPENQVARGLEVLNREMKRYLKYLNN